MQIFIGLGGIMLKKLLCCKKVEVLRKEFVERPLESQEVGQARERAAGSSLVVGVRKDSMLSSLQISSHIVH